MRLIARHGDREWPVEVERHGSGYRVKLGDRWLIADLVDGGFVRSLRLEDGTQFSFAHHREGTHHEISLSSATIHLEMIDPLSLKVRRREDDLGGGGVIKALMSGRIVRIMVTAGQSVRKGEGLLVLEAMKMENEIQAPTAGVIDQILVGVGDIVDAGADLVHLSS